MVKIVLDDEVAAEKVTQHAVVDVIQALSRDLSLGETAYKRGHPVLIHEL